MIHCRTLGPITVRLAGGDMSPALMWRKNLGLLIYLARSPRLRRTRDHLIGLLWAEKSEQAARHSLREAVRVLRRALGDGGLITEQDQVELLPDAVRLDTEDLVACEEAGDWERAAQLIGGEFLEGFGIPDASLFEDWLSAERLAWRGRSVTALTNRSLQLLSQGNEREARDFAERALQLDAGAERAARTLMTALALLGDRSGALQAYEQLAQRARDDGRPLEPETEQLAESVRASRRWMLDAQVPMEPDSGAELRRAPLVGRSRELQALLDLWAAVKGGRAAVAIIEADAGLGKTRLAEEVVVRARLDGATVGAVRAVEADSQQPGATALALGRAQGFAALRDAEPTSIVDTLRNSLEVATHERPALVFVDDAHWSDPESLHALTAALRDLANRPLFLLFAVQRSASPEPLEHLRAHFQRDVQGRAFQLDALDHEALEDLANWAAPDYDDAAVGRLARRIHADSGGRPLLAMELLHAVALGLELGTITGPWPAQDKTLDQTLPGDLPDQIVAAIRIGFRRLSSEAQEILATASVLGERVPTETLQTVTELDRDATVGALDELEWQRWLVAEPRGYSFVARIVREVIARDMLTPGQRRRIEATGSPRV